MPPTLLLRRALAGLLLLAVAACGGGPAEKPVTQSTALPPSAPATPAPVRMIEQTWTIPGGPDEDGRPAMLKARVFSPPGNGPFSVAIINHGSPGNPGRQIMELPSYREASEWFVQRGYMVVLPLRRGYGEVGAWPENPGSCENPDFVAAGDAAADDIVAVVRHVRSLSRVKRDRILLVGQSAGGFGAVAAGSRNPAGVFGVINIAGGRLAGDKDTKCAPDRLVAANEHFGKSARVPSLWLYSENDSYFDPELSKRMVSAYGGAGGRAVYVLVGAFKEDGHTLFGDPDGRATWTPYVASFLEALE
jgi:dienelactone hydrolase